MAASEVLDERVAGADHAGGAQPFQSAHRGQSSFEPAMIGFNGIVRVLLHDMARGGQQLIEHSRVGRCPICRHLAGSWAVLEGTGGVENRRVAARSRFWDTSTSMTCPN